MILCMYLPVRVCLCVCVCVFMCHGAGVLFVMQFACFVYTLACVYGPTGC